MALEQVKWGVVVVDIQGDFTTWKGGSLAAPASDERYVSEVEMATRRMKDRGFKAIATQDWHPANHVSFYTNHAGKKPLDVITVRGRPQVLWPPHCIQGSPGAEILIDNSLFDAVVQKGMDAQFDSYSGFEDQGGYRTALDNILKELGINRLVIYGIATDYCVRDTALHGIEYGYRVVVIEGLCRGIAPDTTEGAIREMEEKGVVAVCEIKDLSLIEEG